MTSRNYPKDSLKQALVVAQRIKDDNAGAPMNRLLVADALGIKPASSNFKFLLSSSRSYGLTEGTEKATDVSLTPLGQRVVSSAASERTAALRQAVLNVPLFKEFFERFNGNKLPNAEMMQKLLAANFGVAADRSAEAASLIQENGDFIGILRSISGSVHVLMEASSNGVPSGGSSDTVSQESDEVDDGTDQEIAPGGLLVEQLSGSPEAASTPSNGASSTKPIFIGHGGSTGSLEKVTSILSGFKIPHKVAVAEPSLGRPIPQKVRDIMLECGSAILIFTKDHRFTDEDGKEIWRPSENVVHELGASSFAYEDRIVIFKEKGITLPSNFSSIGYIEFEENAIEAKTAELLKELIGFGLVKITPTG
jgi:hypothetical protein